MPNNPPYRPNAYHQGNVCVNGPLNHHWRTVDIAAGSVSALSPTPDMRPDPSAGTGGACDCSEAYTPTYPNDNWNSVFFGDGTGEKWQGSAANLLTLQTFTPSGANYDPRTCYKYGFKNLLLKRLQHGQFGYLEKDGYAPDPAEAPCQTKYLNKSASATFYTNPSVPPTDTLSASTTVCTYTSAINPLAGTNTTTYSESNTLGLSDFYAMLLADCDYSPYGTTDIPSVATWLAFWAWDSLSVTTGGTSASYTDNFENPDGSFGQQFTITTTRTNTHYEWHILWKQSYLTVTYLKQEYTGSMTLSTTNTVTDIKNDLTLLGSYWPLNDDLLYPWRADEWFPIMPMVQRREVQTVVPPSFHADVSYVDPHVTAGFDGSIIGKPNTAGAMGWFDFYGQYYRTCIPDGPVPPCTNFLTYSYTYGGTASDHHVSVCNAAYLSGPAYSTFLPLAATHWTNNLMAHDIPDGAGIWIKEWLDDGAIYLCKAAFAAKQPYKSINFARPCGDADKYQVDEPTLTFATAIAAGVITLDTPFASVTDKTILVAFTGDPGTDGIYTGSTLAGSNLTLGTRTGDLPAGYTHPCSETYSDGLTSFGLVGILRWPAAAACAGQWNDTSHKGDLRYGGWFTDGRNAANNTFACNADRLPFSQCYPNVICISPNGETWPSVTTPDGDVAVGKTYWFGADGLPSFTADAVYGTSVVAKVEFSVVDPFYQTPKCGTDPAPRVEARCDSVLSAGYGGGAASNEQPPAFTADALGQTPAWPAMVKPSASGVVGTSYTVKQEEWLL